MIKKSEVEFYQANAGKAYDKNNIENKKIGETLKGLYNKIASASEKAATSMFGEIAFIKLPHAIRSKEHSDIRPYLFTRFSPRNKYSSIATYWFFLEGRPEHNKKHFRISLGLFDNNSDEDLLDKGVTLNNEFRLENSIFLDTDITEEDLTKWIVESIESFELSYDEFCEKLQPDLDDVLSKLTKRQDKKEKNNHEQNIWKMSHGKEKDISEASHEWLIENGYIAIGYDPEDSQRKNFEKMQPDDFFYLVRKSKIVLLGQIDGREILDTPDHLNQPNWVMRKFKNVQLPINELDSTQVPGRKGWKPQNNSTVNVVNENDLIEFEKTILEPAFGLSLSDLLGTKPTSKINKKIDGERGSNMLNTILYGPPGTGKTFNTINKALEILGADIENLDRSQVKKVFEGKVNSHQIVFTTFHQSMSYEDFIEGIKPNIQEDLDANEDSNTTQHLSYKIEDGIFKIACAFAAYSCYRTNKQNKSHTQAYSFEDLYSNFVWSLRSKLESNIPIIFKSLREQEIEVKEINKKDSIIARTKDSRSDSSAPLTQRNLHKLYEKFEDVNDIKSLQQIRDVIEIQPRTTEFYAVFRGLKEFERTFEPNQELLEETKELSLNLHKDKIQEMYNNGLFDDAVNNTGMSADPVVLIIDEINRGNVSQIFGELITLIEDDKRLGKPEKIDLTLPYSKKKFGVPPNLFIIGTMNTADRSVEALDAALRRRFSFIEMPPKPELISKEGLLKEQEGKLDSIDLPELLKTINKRIEKLLDKDHQIGHSYFMSVQNLDDLSAAFKYKIIPLLQEYFFGDYGKIGLVLGEGFVSSDSESNKISFAKFSNYEAVDFEERVSYQIIDVSRNNIVDAVNRLLNKNKENAE